MAKYMSAQIGCQPIGVMLELLGALPEPLGALPILLGASPEALRSSPQALTPQPPLPPAGEGESPGCPLGVTGVRESGSAVQRFRRGGFVYPPSAPQRFS